MKKFIFIILIMFSTSLYAEWELITKSEDNKAWVYLDTERIKKIDGFTYYWTLINYHNDEEAKNFETKSSTSYHKADCKLFREKTLNLNFYKKLFGRGDVFESIDTSRENWFYPPPVSISEYSLGFVCRND